MLFRSIENAWGIFVYLGLAGAAAYAVERPISFQPDIAASSTQWATVSGKVSFERHNTIVPMSGGRVAALCESSACPRSQVYWSVVLNDGMARYEIGEAFDKGSDSSPRAVRLGGVALRPGAEVEIVGLVQPLAPNYDLITAVRSVNVLMDQPEAIGWPKSDGWVCQATLSQDRQLMVQLWYGGGQGGPDRGDDSYHMGVWERSSAQPGGRVLAELDHLSVRVEPSQVVFEGEGSGATAQLALEGYGPQLASFPAQLKFSSGAGAVTAASLDCNRNRFVQY